MLHWSCGSSQFPFLPVIIYSPLSIPVLFSAFHFRPFQNCTDIFTIVEVFVSLLSPASLFCSWQELNCHFADYVIQICMKINLSFILESHSFTCLHFNFICISSNQILSPSILFLSYCFIVFLHFSKFLIFLSWKFPFHVLLKNT